jgi:hypothetical protein
MKDEVKARKALRTVAVGALLVVVFGLLVFLPLLLGRGSINRYIVAFSLIGVLLGASFLLHGGWDWVRSR